MQMQRWFVFAVVLIAPLGACGDSSDDEPLACTDVGCSDGVHLEVREARDAWPAGDYTVEISAGGDSHRCTATLPNPSPWTAESTTFKCDRTSLSASFRPTQGCDDERDGGTDGVTCGVLALEVPGTPSSVQVQIDRDGQSILDESVQPKYREMRPNGEGCEPVCERSSAELTLSE